jgi:hypothetical protein
MIAWTALIGFTALGVHLKAPDVPQPYGGTTFYAEMRSEDRPKLSAAQKIIKYGKELDQSTMRETSGDWSIEFELDKDIDEPPNRCVIKQKTVRLEFFSGELSSIALDYHNAPDDKNDTTNDDIKFILLDSRKLKARTEYKKLTSTKNDPIVIDDTMRETTFSGQDGLWQPLELLINSMSNARRMIIEKKDGSRHKIFLPRFDNAVKRCRG